MEAGKYKTPSGEILNVIQTNEETKLVLVDYGDRKAWHPEEEYLTWEKINDEPKSQEEGLIEPELELLIEEPEPKEELKKKKVAPKKTTTKKPPKKK